MHRRSSHSTVFGLLSLLALALAVPMNVSAAVAVGDVAPAFSLRDANGTTHSLAQYKGKTVVLEWINPNCPFSRRQAVEGTMNATFGKHPQVVWLSINSTATGHGDFLTPAQHNKWNGEHAIRYPVLYDSDGAVGHAYGARTTPHMYVIDGQGKLAYAGAIDDDPPGRKDKAARSNYVDQALAAMATGKSPDPNSTTPYGCSVKYGS
jgi:peroxiredoxin